MSMRLARCAAVGGLALACASTSSPVRAAEAPARPRVIVSSDLPPLDVIPGKGARVGDPPEKVSDPDDIQSMVRFLLYANEMDVEGLVVSAGTLANDASWGTVRRCAVPMPAMRSPFSMLLCACDVA